MRLRLNRSLKTKTKKKTEHGEGRQTAGEKINKIKHKLDATELIIQIAFITSIIMANFISFYTLHVAALIILFKGLTNFPKERDNEEPRVHMLPKNRKLMRLPRNWGGRKRRKKHEWRHTKCMTKLILVAMEAINLSDTIAKLNNPDNPKHTFKRLLYSLAHDTMVTNNPGNDIPIRTATMTRNRSKIRKDLKNLINSLNSITEYGKKTLDNIVNVRNKDVRNVTKMILKVWTFLLRTHTNPKKTKEYWSPKNCGECDICDQRGPQSLCPYCNVELIGFANYLKVKAEIVVTLPSDILKSMAWKLIKHLLISTLDKVLAHLMYHETTPLAGLFIRLRTTIIELISNPSREHRKYDKTKDSQEKETKNKRRKGRKKQRKRKTNLTWHLRHKKREPLKGNKQKPRTRSTRPNYQKGRDTIAQYDRNDDPNSDTEVDDTLLENVHASTYG